MLLPPAPETNRRIRVPNSRFGRTPLPGSGMQTAPALDRATLTDPTRPRVLRYRPSEPTRSTASVTIPGDRSVSVRSRSLGRRAAASAHIHPAPHPTSRTRADSGQSTWVASHGNQATGAVPYLTCSRARAASRELSAYWTSRR